MTSPEWNSSEPKFDPKRAAQNSAPRTYWFAIFSKAMIAIIVALALSVRIPPSIFPSLFFPRQISREC